MNYIILNSDGSIYKRYLDEYIQQGSNNVNTLFFARTDITSFSGNGYAYCSLPDGETTNIIAGVWGSQEIDGTTYYGYLFTITAAQTLYNGVLKLSVVFIQTDSTILVTYPVALIINETGYQPDSDSGVTIEELNNFLVNISNYVPYSGAINNVDLGSYYLKTRGVFNDESTIYGELWGLYFYENSSLQLISTSQEIALSSYSSLDDEDVIIKWDQYSDNKLTLVLPMDEADSLGGVDKTLATREWVEGNYYSITTYDYSDTALQGITIDGTQYRLAPLGSVADNNSVAIGNGSQASGTNSTAYGYQAYATSQGALALGSQALAQTGQDTIAIGNASTSEGYSSVAIGTSSTASGTNSIAIGKDSESSSSIGVAVGASSTASGTNSVSLGAYSRAKAQNSVSIGCWARTSIENTVTFDGTSSSNQRVLLMYNPSNIVFRYAYSNENYTTLSQYTSNKSLQELLDLKANITYVDSLVSTLKANAFISVDTTTYPTLDEFLATEGEEGYIYLYPIDTSDLTQGYYQYIWESSAWLSIGTTVIDLSDYVQKTTTIAGVDLQDDITSSELLTALGLEFTDVEIDED